MQEMLSPLDCRVKNIVVCTVLALILVAGGYLAFKNLDQTAFWDDEAQVAIIAQNFNNQGELTAWDGRNLYGYRNGTLLDQNLHPRNPPFQYLITALSFKLFGVSTWAGRAPFVLLGLTSLGVLLLLMKEDFGKPGLLHIFCLANITLSPVFLLNIRQCLYYGLGILLPVLIFLSYRRVMATTRIIHGILLAVAMTFLFYAHFLLCAAFVMALAAMHLFFHFRSTNNKQWRVFLLAAALFLIATLPYAIFHQIWIRPDMVVDEPFFLRKFNLFIMNLWGMNLMGCLPILLLPAFALPSLVKPVDRNIYQNGLEWLVLGWLNVLFVALLSPQPTAQTTLADLRYLACSIPFLSVAGGIAIFIISRKSMATALLLLGLLLFSNILSLPIRSQGYQWRLPAFVKEVHGDYPTAYGEVANFLDRQASREDVVSVFPEYHTYPLMFYNGERLRFGALLDQQTPLSDTLVRNMGTFLYKEETFPNWLIFFGKSLQQDQIIQYFSRSHGLKTGQKKYQYDLYKRIDVYYLATHRPEIAWHSFSPILDFDQESEAVYVFRRAQAPLPLKAKDEPN